VELPGQLLRPAALGKPRPPDPLLAPHLCDLFPVHGHEDPRVAAGGEVAEDRAVEAVLRLGDEVDEVVWQRVVVTGRAAPEVG
jgi:hypothetical protein